MSFFWRYIPFFRYFLIMLICNCFWIILLWTFWNPCNFTVVRLTYPVSNFMTNQITSCSCCFLNRSFWRSFKRIWCRMFSRIKKFFTLFTTQVFSKTLSKNLTKTLSLLQILDLQFEQNIWSSFIFYTLINN